MNLEPKRAIVVGASSGIGAACVLALTRSGYTVAAVARRKADLEKVCQEASTSEARALGYTFDVNRFSETADLFDKILTDLKGLDLFIYAAGTMPEIGKEEYNFAKDERIVATNLLGAIAWCNEAAQFFARTEQGTLVGISSVAGERGRRGNPVYCASKSGLNTYLEALRNRLDPHGVKVLTVKPGFVDTAMTRGKPGIFWLITADEAARRIVEAATRGCRQEIFVPRRWRWVMAVIRAIPSWIFRKLDI